MLVLLVLGVMSLFWMALVAVAIFAEKALPHARGSRRSSAPASPLGICVAVSRGSVPALTQPGKG